MDLPYGLEVESTGLSIDLSMRGEERVSDTTLSADVGPLPGRFWRSTLARKWRVQSGRAELEMLQDLQI